MEGRIGGLFKDENQIGGFLDWKFEVILANTPFDVIKYKFAKWRLEASSYWLFSEPDIVTVRLYHATNAYWEGEGRIITRLQNVFDAMIHERIEIIGEGQLIEHRSNSLHG